MGESSIRVITFNLKRDHIFSRKRWERRRDGVCGFLNKEGADIIGVQELLPDMKNDIEACLSKNNYRIIGEGRNRNLDGEHTDIIYSEDTLELIGHSTFWLSKSPEKAGSRSHMTLYPRICTFAHFRIKESLKEFYVYNTHFDHISPFARLAGANMIIKRIEKCCVLKPLPVIVMGDFNTHPNSETVKTLYDMRDVNLKNVLGNDNILSTMSRGGRFFDRQIDYILVSDEFKVIGAEVRKLSSDDNFLSDHNPVIADLVL